MSRYIMVLALCFFAPVWSADDDMVESYGEIQAFKDCMNEVMSTGDVANLRAYLLENYCDQYMLDDALRKVARSRCDDNYVEIARVLIEHGAGVNAAGAWLDEVAPLIEASRNTCLPMLELMVQHSAKPDIQYCSSAAISPMFLVLCNEKMQQSDQLKAVQLLLKYGACPGNTDCVCDACCFMHPPLACVPNVAVAKVLIDAGADIEKIVPFGCGRCAGKNILSVQTEFARKEVVHCLLGYGAKVRVETCRENALYQAALRMGGGRSSRYVIGRWLLHAGAFFEMREDKETSKITFYFGLSQNADHAVWYGTLCSNEQLMTYMKQFPRVRCLRNMALDVIRVHAPKDIELSKQADWLPQSVFQYEDEVENDPNKWPQGYAPLQLPYGFEPHPEQQKEPSCN